MVNYLLMRFVHVVEYLRMNGFRKLFNELFYWHRAAVLVEKELQEVNRLNLPLTYSDFSFIEMTPEIFTSQMYEFAQKNRALKAKHYFGMGYMGHALLLNNRIVGDIWYSSGNFMGESQLHPDVILFGMDWSEGCVYSFDIFVVPECRGGNVSALLQNFSMLSLKNQGFKKILAYYWADNYPAIWNTRVINKWNEVGRRNISRLLFSRF